MYGNEPGDNGLAPTTRFSISHYIYVYIRNTQEVLQAALYIS